MWKRWRLRIGLGLLAAFAGLYLYLGSSSVAGQVRDRLKQLFQVEVSVASARIGLVGNSIVHEVAVQERDQAVGEVPLVRVAEANLGLTLFGVLWTGLPSSIDLNGTQIHLRFDTDGKLLSGLPTLENTGVALPPIRVHNGSITLDQKGRKPLTLTGAEVQITSEGGNTLIRGTIADPTWGQWDIAAEYQPIVKLVLLTLSKPDAALTMEMLEQIPFVAPSVWQAVKEVSGTTGVVFTLRVPIGQPVRYKVVLDVACADLTVPSIDLRATEVRGGVTVEDSLVTLDGVNGKFADGTLATSGTLDFRKPPSTLRFDLDARKIDLTRLPQSYREKGKLPEQLSGRFDMRAKLEVETSPFKLTGKGEGDIVGAAFGKFPLLGLIPLKLTTDGKKFQFRPTLSPLMLLPRVGIEGVADRALVRVRPEDQSLPVEWFRRVGEGVVDGTLLGIDATWRGMARMMRPRQPDEPISYLEAETGLDGVDLVQLAREAKVQLSRPVDGIVSFRVLLGIPLEPLARLRDYRLDGRVAVARLLVGDMRLATGAGGVHLDNGLLTLDPFSGMALVPIPNRPMPPLGPAIVAGPAYLLTMPTLRYDGSAKLQLDPPGDANANLTIRGVPVDRVLAGLTEGAVQAQGVLDGRLVLKAPVRRMGDFEAWTGRGVVEMARLDASGIRLRDLLVELRMQDKRLTVPSIAGKLQDTPLKGTGQVELAEPYPIEGSVEVDAVEVTSLPAIPPEVRGRLALSILVGGDLRTGATLGGRVESERLALGTLALEQPRADWKIDGPTLRLDRISASFARGTLEGEGTLPLSAKRSGSVAVQARNLSAEALVRAVPGVPLRIAGTISGELGVKIGVQASDGRRPVEFELEATAPLLRIEEVPVRGTTARLRFDGQQGSLALRGEALGAEIGGEGTFRAGTWQAGGKVKNLRLDRLDAELGGSTGLQMLRGLVEFEFAASRSGEGAEKGTGRLTVRGLGWQGYESTEDIRADLLLDGPRLRVGPVEGRLAGGSFRLGLDLNRHQPERNTFDMRCGGIRLDTLLGPLLEMHSDGQVPIQRTDGKNRLADGLLDLTIAGNLGRQWRAEGVVGLSSASVLGADLEEARLPFRLVRESSGSGSLVIEDSTGRLARGHVRGGLRIGWGDAGRAVQVLGGYQVTAVGLGDLLRGRVNTLGSLAASNLSGRIDVQGTDVRSLEDLKMNFEATMTQTPLLQMPILSSLTPYLRAIRPELPFDSGTIRGRLVRGLVEIDGLYLSSRLLRVAVSGTISPTTNRLDLTALALVGPELFPGPSLSGRVPRTGPMPGGILEEMTRFLTTRAIRLSIGGSTRSPIVRPEPLRSLSDEMARFFGGG